MAERQIVHRKSCLVLSARFPVVNWRSRPVAKSVYFLHRDFNLINISGHLIESDRLNLILKFLFLFILDLPKRFRFSFVGERVRLHVGHKMTNVLLLTA